MKTKALKQLEEDIHNYYDYYNDHKPIIMAITDYEESSKDIDKLPFAVLMNAYYTTKKTVDKGSLSEIEDIYYITGLIDGTKRAMEILK